MPALYLVGYLALVDPLTLRVTPGGIIETVNYRGGGRVVEVLFWPLEQLDRRWRPETWEGRQHMRLPARITRLHATSRP